MVDSLWKAYVMRIVPPIVNFHYCRVNDKPVLKPIPQIINILESFHNNSDLPQLSRYL
jgi:hypothetical protein